MARLATAIFALAAFAVPAFALEFTPTDQGQVMFDMPSGNVGCIYTPEGGTSFYVPEDGGPELSCDRVEPSYVRVSLGARGKVKRYDHVDDPSCCGADNVFSYGEIWEMDGFSCISATTGLTCTRGTHGFSMARKAVKVW
jgi:hypothetical protein